MNRLIGATISAAKINDERDRVLLDTDQGTFFLSWNGDCCAQCYMCHISGSEALIGATILEVHNAEWVELSNEDCEVVESMGTKFRTTKGYVDFETRLEHNGYYGGEITVDEEGFKDQYRWIEKSPEDPKMRPIVDF